ncbi:hypothetical protein MACH15_26520 [Maricaulis maris]|nr:hypothetical protein MACH15_26520 [Maricaulis maris]
MLQGVTVVQVLMTPIIGLSKSASSMPVARSMARAGARAGPAVMASEDLRWSCVIRVFRGSKHKKPRSGFRERGFLSASWRGLSSGRRAYRSRYGRDNKYKYEEEEAERVHPLAHQGGGRGYRQGKRFGHHNQLFNLYCAAT